MRPQLISLAFSANILALTAAYSQAGKFPPDSLVNVRIIAKSAPPAQVISQMQYMSGALGVQCTFCHVGEEGPLDKIDYISDQKRTKIIARQMMVLSGEINSRLSAMPLRSTRPLHVACADCHRGRSRPVPLFTIVADAAIAVNADSALRAYRALRERYYGRDAYDFGESALSIAALDVALARKVVDALAILEFNETLFPNSSGTYVARGNILLRKPDTASAAAAFRRALQLDSTNAAARKRLLDIGQRP